MPANVVPFQKPEQRSLLPTSGHARLRSMCVFCQTYAKIGVGIGRAGVGKTTQAVKYAAEFERALYVALKKRNTTVLQLAGLLKEAIGLNRTSIEYDVERRLGESYEYGGLVIIDECQWISPATYDWLRSSQETRHFGLVLIGNAEVFQIFERSRRPSFEQLTSRITMRVILDTPSAEDFDLFFDHFAVAGVKARNRIREIAERDGNFRAVEDIIQCARALDPKARTLELSHIDQAIGMLGR